MSQSSATSRHPFIELLARYRSVFHAAWEARHELAGPKLLADEAAFLPGALSLQATPVHPAPRRAMWVIVALFVCALAWSILGEVDIVAVAPGRIVVSDSTKLIQPLDSGVVKAIRVQDGDHVAQGQVLVELDATSASADARSNEEQLRAQQSEARRSEALLSGLRTGAAPLSTKPEDTELLRTEWSDIAAKQAKLDAELQRRRAELSTAQEVLAKLQATVPLARQREADFKALADQGYVAGHAGQDKTRERIELERDLATQLARVKEAEAAEAETRQEKASYLAETQRTLSDRLAQAKLKAAALEQEAAKSEHREKLTQLRAPVSGTVQQLAIHTPGGVVTAAQQLMVIVPDEAQVTAEVAIDNKDIGFVRAGQHAEVKLETFSYTRYGTVPARVQWVTADAVNDEKRGALFPATLTLMRPTIDVDGKSIRLGPGMNVTAEIKTGRRRVIDYLLDPLKQHASESIRER
jgi:hemolysin D